MCRKTSSPDWLLFQIWIILNMYEKFFDDVYLDYASVSHWENKKYKKKKKIQKLKPKINCCLSWSTMLTELTQIQTDRRSKRNGRTENGSERMNDRERERAGEKQNELFVWYASAKARHNEKFQKSFAINNIWVTNYLLFNPKNSMWMTCEQMFDHCVSFMCVHSRIESFIFSWIKIDKCGSRRPLAFCMSHVTFQFSHKEFYFFIINLLMPLGAAAAAVFVSQYV